MSGKVYGRSSSMGDVEERSEDGYCAVPGRTSHTPAWGCLVPSVVDATSRRQFKLHNCRHAFSLIAEPQEGRLSKDIAKLVLD
jgi:hypothetical protein